MGYEGDTGDVPMTPVVHKFGDEELSDVTFIVGGEEFKCDKRFLATRSSYFKAMFYSDFKEKDQDRVTIETDPIAFKRLMELIYTGMFSSWSALDCEYESCYGCDQMNDRYHNRCYFGRMWDDVAALVQLADLFDVRSYTLLQLENYLVGTKNCSCKVCPRTGAKLLIALVYNMEKYEAKSTVPRSSMAAALQNIPQFPTFALSRENLEWLLKLQ